MVVPVPDKTAQQIRPAQQGALARRRTADHDVVAAACSGVAAVEHELLGAQPRLSRFLVERRGVVHQLVPVRRRVQVDLDHSRVGSDRQVIEA